MENTDNSKEKTRNTKKATTKKNTKTPKATNGKKTRGQAKTWTVSDFRAKHKLTIEQGQQAIQGAGLVMGKHIVDGKLNKVALMLLGKWMKKNPFPEPVEIKSEDGKVIKELVVADVKPPNERRLWVFEKGIMHGTKMVCHVQKKVWQSHHKGMILLCEKIGEDLYVHPPIRS